MYYMRRNDMNKPKELIYLNSLRGMAAIYVLIFHARWLLTESYSNRSITGHEGFPQKIVDMLFSFFRFGHQAVMLFFVLSGFLIHYSMIKAVRPGDQKNNGSWIKYYIKRINRIYPPFIFALLFTLFLDYIGKNVLELQVYYTGSKYFSLFLSKENFSTPVFLGNLFNVQGFLCSIFGSNIALWSLSFEWWFYLLFPVFYLIHKKSKIAALAIQLILFIISVFFSAHFKIPILYPLFTKMLIWWIGVLLADVYVGRIKVSTFHLSFLMLAIPLSILLFDQDLLIGDLFWGLGFAGVFCFLFSQKNEHVIIRMINKLAFTANFSFTLYLLHLPILYLVHAYLIERYYGKLPYTYTWVLCISIIIIFLAKQLAKWLENIKIFSESWRN